MKSSRAEYNALFAEWCALVERNNELDRRIGTRPWEWRKWADRRNPFMAGSEEAREWHAVQQLGIQVERRMDDVSARLDEARRRVIGAIVALRADADGQGGG